MGKALVIKGADFSANRIDVVTPLEPLNISDLFTIQNHGLAWLRSTEQSNSGNSAGNKLDNGVDIRPYLQMGYTKIKVVYKQDTWIVKGNSNTSTIDSNRMNNCVYANDTTGQTWDTQSLDPMVINPSYPYLYVGLRKTATSTNWTGTLNVSDYIDIILVA